MKNDEKIQTTITQEIPEWKLKLAYFYTENKVFIKRASLFMFFFVDLLILFMLGTMWINYKTGLLKDETYLSQLSVNLVNNQTIEKFQPQDLYFEKPIVIPTNNDKYNFIVKVINNNEVWAVMNIKYTFVVAGQELEPKNTFILPASEKYLMYFNAASAQNIQLKILDTSWQRIRDFSLLSYKDKFEITKSNFEASNSNIYSGISTIEIYNDSPFDYWEIGAPIVLYDKAMQPLAVDYIVINKLLSRETRELELNWYENIETRVYKTEVYPEVNLLNENVIMKLETTPDSPSGYE